MNKHATAIGCGAYFSVVTCDDGCAYLFGELLSGWGSEGHGETYFSPKKVDLSQCVSKSTAFMEIVPSIVCFFVLTI